MKLTIRAASIIRKGPERDLIDDYMKRAQGLSKACGFLKLSEQQVDLRSAKSRAEETQLMLANLPPNTKIVLLDERGKQSTSRDIAKQLTRWRDDGFSETVFVIGGADGFEPTAIPPNVTKWAFGPQVWPHKLVRVMLTEQIYRALSILAGTPYHRD